MHHWVRTASTPLLLTLLLCLGALTAGCESEELKENERQEINRILSTGVQFDDDPYVRAETLRILEVLADARFDSFARQRAEDDSFMVRVAAIRVLLATGNSEAERLALATYSKAPDDVRLALMRAAIEYGPESLRQQLFDRAMRSKDIRLRQLAFERGTLDKVRRAIRDDDQQKLKVELVPKLSKLVDNEDYDIAAASLEQLDDIGRGDRADPLLKAFQSERTSLEERIKLARTLRMAGIERAKPLFVEIAEAAAADDGAEAAKKLGIPTEQISPRLVRAAVLGAVALGDESLVRRAQEYLRNADTEQSREVLEALATNPSKDATVSLKIAMQDARPSIRHRAIELYGARTDAKAKALINALRQEDAMARRKIANILVARFPQKWARDLRLQLRAEERKDIVLGLLRDVIDRERDRAILGPIAEQLQSIVAESEGERAATAAYLLLLSDPDNAEYQTALQQHSDVRTRYVFMEHLMRTQPRDSVEIFRRYFYDDLYAMRLIAAAGLWRAFNNEEGAGQDPAPEQEAQADEER